MLVLPVSLLEKERSRDFAHERLEKRYSVEQYVVVVGNGISLEAQLELVIALILVRKRAKVHCIFGSLPNASSNTELTLTRAGRELYEEEKPHKNCRLSGFVRVSECNLTRVVVRSPHQFPVHNLCNIFRRVD